MYKVPALTTFLDNNYASKQASYYNMATHVRWHAGATCYIFRVGLLRDSSAGEYAHIED